MEKVWQAHVSLEPRFYAGLGPVDGNIIWETHIVVLPLTKFCLYLGLFDSYYPCDTKFLISMLKTRKLGGAWVA